MSCCELNFTVREFYQLLARTRSSCKTHFFFRGVCFGDYIEVRAVLTAYCNNQTGHTSFNLRGSCGVKDMKSSERKKGVIRGGGGGGGDVSKEICGTVRLPV